MEVFFGDLGWIEFDPTSEKLAPGEEFSFFTGPDKDKLAKLIREILENQDDLKEVQPAQDGLPATASRAAVGIARAVLLVARLWYVTLPTLFLLYLLSVKLLPSLAGLLSANARRRARSLYRLCLARLQGVGLARKAKESHFEYAKRIETEKTIALCGMTDVFLKAVFADSFSEEDMHAAREAHRIFLASYRSRVHLVVRILGTLNPIGALRLSPPSGRP